EVDLVFDVLGGDIAKRSAGVIRVGGTLVTITGPTEARPAGGLTIDFVVVPDRAQLSEVVQRVRNGRLQTSIGKVADLDDAVVGGSVWLSAAAWSNERAVGKFRSFRGLHGRGDVPLPQFIDSVVCVGSYGRGDTLWDIAYRRLQHTNSLGPLGSSHLVSCHR